MADEEDVAQQAFWGFYKSLKAGRLPQLRNRNDLWAVMVAITARQAVSLLEHELRQKRGGGQVRGESALEQLADSSQMGRGIEQYPAEELAPEEEAALQDCYAYFLDGLEPSCRKVAELYLAGYTQQEIASKLGCARRTVVRKLAIAFDHWQERARQIME